MSHASVLPPLPPRPERTTAAVGADGLAQLESTAT